MLGNQPKMKADPKSPANQIKWVFAGGTNFDPAKDMHMHEGTVKFVDDDHIEFSGAAWVNGKPAEDHCVTMKLVRKKRPRRVPPTGAAPRGRLRPFPGTSRRRGTQREVHQRGGGRAGRERGDPRRE